MGLWSKKKVDPLDLNKGYEWTKDDQVAVEELNAMTNCSLYAQDFVEKLVTNIDVSEAGLVGTPSVTLVDGDGATKDKPYKKFKFANLKGEKGDTGGVAPVVQGTGTATGSVMSQNAVTTELESKANLDASNLSDENVASWREKLSISGDKGGISLKEIINVTCSNQVTIAGTPWVETPIIYDTISKHAGGNLLSYDNTTGKIKIPANSGYSFVKITSNGAGQMTQYNTSTNWAMGIHETINGTITNLSTLTIPYIPSNGATATSPYTIINIADVDQDNDTYINAYFTNGYTANNKFVVGTNLTIECY